MELDVAVHGPNLMARVAGDLDVATAGALRQALEDALNRHRVRTLYLDLSEAGFLDSSGLGVILGRFKRLRQTGGRMVLVSPSPTVRPVLELAGLFKLMEVQETGGGTAAG